MSVKENMLEILEGIDIRFKEPLHSYSYTKVGGEADYLVFPRNRFELARVVKFANQENIPWMVLGNASNIIVRDGGIRGLSSCVTSSITFPLMAILLKQKLVPT